MYLSKSFPWQTSRNRLQVSRTEEKNKNVSTWTEFPLINPNYKIGPMANCLTKWLIKLFKVLYKTY